jgi:hypothetical protein
MMTISPYYAAQVLEVYVKKTENTKFTGDKILFLMLTLPFLVLDLISPEEIYNEFVLGIDQMNSMHIIYINLVYTWYITCKFET